MTDYDLQLELDKQCVVLDEKRDEIKPSNKDYACELITTALRKIISRIPQMFELIEPNYACFIFEWQSSDLQALFDKIKN